MWIPEIANLAQLATKKDISISKTLQHTIFIRK